MPWPASANDKESTFVPHLLECSQTGGGWGIAHLLGVPTHALQGTCSMWALCWITMNYTVPVQKCQPRTWHIPSKGLQLWAKFQLSRDHLAKTITKQKSAVIRTFLPLHPTISQLSLCPIRLARFHSRPPFCPPTQNPQIFNFIEAIVFPHFHCKG